MALTAKREASSDSAPAAGGLLTEHFRQLLRVAPIALVIALIVGGMTLAITESADPEYQVVATAQIDAQVPVVTGDAYLFQNSAPYLALAASNPVHQTIADRMGEGWDGNRVGSSVTVGVSQSPLLLDVTATAPTPEDAARLAQETIEVLDASSREQRAREFERAATTQTQKRQELQDRLARLPSNSRERAGLQLQIDELQTQIDRVLAGGVNGLSALPVPDAGDAVQTAPRSPTLALFVCLVTFLIVAEVLALVRTRFGRGITLAEVRRISRSRGIAIEVAPQGLSSLPPVTHALAVRYFSRGERTQLLASPATESQVRQWHSALPDATVMAPIGQAWAFTPDQSVAQAVLVVGLGEPFRDEVRDAADVIRELGIAGRIVLLPVDKAPAQRTMPDRSSDTAAAGEPGPLRGRAVDTEPKPAPEPDVPIPPWTRPNKTPQPATQDESS